LIFGRSETAVPVPRIGIGDVAPRQRRIGKQQQCFSDLCEIQIPDFLVAEKDNLGPKHNERKNRNPSQTAREIS